MVGHAVVGDPGEDDLELHAGLDLEGEQQLDGQREGDRGHDEGHRLLQAHGLARHEREGQRAHRGQGHENGEDMGHHIQSR